MLLILESTLRSSARIAAVSPCCDGPLAMPVVPDPPELAVPRLLVPGEAGDCDELRLAELPRDELPLAELPVPDLVAFELVRPPRLVLPVAMPPVPDEAEPVGLVVPAEFFVPTVLVPGAAGACDSPIAELLTAELPVAELPSVEFAAVPPTPGVDEPVAAPPAPAAPPEEAPPAPLLLP